MIRNIIAKIKNKLFTKADIGLSCDSKVKLKEIPPESLSHKSPFYKVNKDLGIFEITKIIKNPELICLSEVGTDNEVVIDRQTFDFLFSNVKVPKEAIF